MMNTRRACFAVFILCGLSSLLCRFPSPKFYDEDIIGCLLLISVALQTYVACILQVFQIDIGRNNNSIPKMEPLSFTREMREQNQRM